MVLEERGFFFDVHLAVNAIGASDAKTRRAAAEQYKLEASITLCSVSVAAT